MGMRGYRLHARISGRPDFYFPSERLAVFVDGCFWHGCPRCKSRPKTNAIFWKKKIEGNRQRDKEMTKKLKNTGVSVLRFWGHTIKKNPQACVEKIAGRLEKLRPA